MSKFTEQITVKIMVFMSLLLGGILIAYSLFAYPYVKAQKNKTVKHVYEIVRGMEIEELLEEQLEDEIELEEENVDMMIFDSSVQLVYASDSTRSGKAVAKRIRRNRKAYQEEAEPMFLENVAGEPIAIMGKMYSGEEEYYVYLYSNMRINRRNITYATQVLLGCFLIVLISTFLFVNLYIREILRPVGEVKEIIGKLCKKEYSSRVLTDMPRNEIADMAENVNQLAEVLYCNANNINNYKYLLENQDKDLAELDVMQKKIVSNVTHQLKTPLAIISSQLELEFQEKAQEKKAYYQNSIMEEIDKMSQLISDILQSSKGRTSPIYVKVYRVCVSELLQEMSLKYKDWLSSKGVLFDAFIEEGIYADIDPVQIEQAVNNYMMNACRHTKSGKKVTLRFYKRENDCFIEVHNEGNGIPKADVDKIWKDYYQRTPEEKAGNMNIGLGLYIVKDIIRQHGGECGVRNDDTGVLFWMKLGL